MLRRALEELPREAFEVDLPELVRIHAAEAEDGQIDLFRARGEVRLAHDLQRSSHRFSIARRHVVGDERLTAEAAAHASAAIVVDEPAEHREVRDLQRATM